MKSILKTPLLLSAWVLLGLLSSPLHAYPAAPFNVRQLLNRADVVCYVQVVAVKSSLIQPDDNFQPSLATDGAVATVKVLSWIKGTTPSTFNVAFRRNTPMVAYTQLAPNESAVVFLTKRSNSFLFLGDHNGKLPVPLHKPLAYTSSSATSRMMAELIFASQADKGAIRFECVKQLGDFHSPQVVSHLSHLTTSTDMAVQGVALASLIRLDRVPDVAHLCAFFKRRDDTRSSQRFGTTQFSNGQLKSGILNALEGRFNRISSDTEAETEDAQNLQTPARLQAQKWKRFDLIRFLRVAITTIEPDLNHEDTDVVAYRDIADMLGEQMDTQGNPAVLHHTVFFPALPFHPNNFRSERAIIDRLGHMAHLDALRTFQIRNCPRYLQRPVVASSAEVELGNRHLEGDAASISTRLL